MTASAAEPPDDLSEPGYRDGRAGQCSTPSVVPGAALPWNSNGRVGGFSIIYIYSPCEQDIGCIYIYIYIDIEDIDVDDVSRSALLFFWALLLQRL